MSSKSRRASKSYEDLLARLGYGFRDPTLLELALTHRSKSGHNYERLEFLGDSVLNLVVSGALYERFPDLSEGELTRLRASLVNKPSLATHARELALGQCLRLGEGELKSGGFDRDSILADALEAVFGAIYLDGGIVASTQVIERIYKSSFATLNPQSVPKDAKTQLQEFLQKRAQPTPVYDVVEISGEAHNQHFVVTCRVSGLDEPVRGAGNSRRLAEQEAANLALRRLLEHA